MEGLHAKLYHKYSEHDESSRVICFTRRPHHTLTGSLLCKLNEQNILRSVVIDSHSNSL